MDDDPTGAAAGYAFWALLAGTAWVAYLTVSTFLERTPL